MVGHCRDTWRLAWWLGTARTLGGWALQGHLVVGHCRDTSWLGTAGTLGGWAAGTLGGWALQGHLVVGHCRDTWWLGTAETLGGWALQGHLVVGHCRDTWWLATAGTLGGWALQGHLVAGHCRDTWWLGTAGTLGGWAPQGHLVVGHCRDTWWLGTAGTLGGWALKSASSRASTTSSLKSNNPTVRVGKKTCQPPAELASFALALHVVLHVALHAVPPGSPRFYTHRPWLGNGYRWVAGALGESRMRGNRKRNIHEHTKHGPGFPVPFEFSALLELLAGYCQPQVLGEHAKKLALLLLPAQNARGFGRRRCLR